MGSSDLVAEIAKTIQTSNVYCTGVPGCGKTRNAIYIAKSYNTEFPDDNICLITYSAHLKHETKTRMIQNKVRNTDVYTFHSLAISIFGMDGYTDEKISELINNHVVAKRKPKYSLIILDECQDMTMLYYELIVKFVTETGNNDAKYLIMGDQLQEIFSFKGSDQRFLTFAPEVFKNGYGWKHFSLNQSYRLTKPMVGFVNNCILGYDRITSEKEGVNVDYIFFDIFDTRSYGELLGNLLLVYQPDDILILLSSTRTKAEWSPITKLDKAFNYLGYDDGSVIPILIKTDFIVDRKSLLGKILITTDHSAKGIERKVVIRIGFSQTQFDKERDNSLVCPNSMYVGITRASEKLILLHHKTSNYLPYLKTENLRHYCNIITEAKISPERVLDEKQSEPIIKSVTKILRYASHELLEKCMKYITVTKQDFRESTKIRLPTISEQPNKLYEDVDAILGLFIQNLYNTSTGCIYSKSEIRNGLKETIKTLCTLEKTKYRRRQITRLNFVTKDMTNKLLTRLEKLIDRDDSFQSNVELIVNIPELGFTLTGEADYIIRGRIGEIKCTGSVESIHFIQLALYMYLSVDESPISELVNPCLNEKYLVTSTRENLRKLLWLIISEKKEHTSTNDEFLTMTETVRTRYV